MSMEGSGIVKYRDDVNKISAVTITPKKRRAIIRQAKNDILH